MTDPRTDLSVVVHSRGAAGRLGKCLAALALPPSAPARVEIVVVGPGAARVGALGALPYLVTVVDTGDAGPAAARGAGARRARGEYCLFLDEQTTAGPALLAAHLGAQRERGGAVVLGPLDFDTPPAAHPFVRYVAARWSEERRAVNGGGPERAILGCERGNVSVPRAAMFDAGAFASQPSAASLTDLVWRLTRTRLSAALAAGGSARFDWDVNFGAAVAAVEERGAAELALYERHPAVLPHLQLARFGSVRPRYQLPHRVLLAAPVPRSALGALARIARATETAPPLPWHLLYEHLYWRGVRRAAPDRDVWRRLTGGVAVLLYHAVGAPGEDGSRYVVPGDRFAWQMRWLARRGYQVLSLGEYLRCRAEHRLPPVKSVVITFDDGYADNLTVAYPVLGAHGFPATVFVVTNSVAETNGWDRGGRLAGRRLLSWDELKQLVAGGLEIGAHTRSHRWLTTLAGDELDDEVAGSRADLERFLRRPVTAFAYPGGMHDARSERAVARAGFAGACGTRTGLNDAGSNLLALRRVDIHGRFSRVAFAWSLAVGTFPPWLRWRRDPRTSPGPAAGDAAPGDAAAATRLADARSGTAE